MQKIGIKIDLGLEGERLNVNDCILNMNLFVH